MAPNTRMVKRQAEAVTEDSSAAVPEIATIPPAEQFKAHFGKTIPHQSTTTESSGM